MTSRDQDIARGKRAEILLNDDMLKEAFETIKKEYRTAWENSPARDQDGRERLWRAVKIVDRVQIHLSNVVNDGKIAQHELANLTRG